MAKRPTRPMAKDYTTKDLEKQLEKLDEQIEDIKLPSTSKEIVCPFCYKKLIIKSDNQILDFCIKCHSSLDFYHVARVKNNIVEEILKVSADFY